MILEIQQVGKKYHDGIWGVEDINWEVTPGIIGLLGPNGAGKSTLLKILATIIKPSKGRVLWNGVNIHQEPQQLRQVLGYLPQDFGLYDNLNAKEFLYYMALLKGLSPQISKQTIDHLLEVVHLADVANRRLGTYSGGMKQRIGIAQALLNDPKILLVDEPTVGLDPQERINFRNILHQLSGEKIIILSTHIVSDIETLANKIAIMDKGRLVVYSNPEQLLTAVEEKVWQIVIPSSELDNFRQRYITSTVSHTPGGVQVRFLAHEPPVGLVQAVVPTLEDAYLFHIHGQRKTVG